MNHLYPLLKLFVCLSIVLAGCTQHTDQGSHEDANNNAIAITAARDSIKTLSGMVDSLNLYLRIERSFWDRRENRGIGIMDDLRNRPDLIPYKGTLGGTMQFDGRMSPLGAHSAIAQFSDGHVAGEMLLSYEMQEDSTIKWTVLDHTIE